LAALQLGVISLDLARDADSWSASFDTDEQAKSYVADLTRQVGELRTLIPLAAAAALARLPRGHKDRVWAEMSPADISFLVEPNPNRVVKAYADAVPKSNLFAWDAARGQLELFASLGVKEKLARDIISAIESDLKRMESRETHVIVFAGH
jgi:hypothetical protein